VRFVYEAFRQLQPGLPVMHLHGKQKQMMRMATYTKFCEQKYGTTYYLLLLPTTYLTTYLLLLLPTYYRRRPLLLLLLYMPCGVAASH
jgi:hypothetical protein